MSGKVIRINDINLGPNAPSRRGHLEDRVTALEKEFKALKRALKKSTVVVEEEPDGDQK